MHKVYVIENTITKELYVGSTQKPLYARMGNHRSKAKSRPRSRLHRSMVEHGSHNFTINAIFETNDPLESCEVEGLVVALLNTIDNGLNTRVPSRHDVVCGKTKLALGQERHANNRMNKMVHTFAHKDGRVEQMTVSQLRRISGGDRSDIRRMVKGECASVKGWRLVP